ANRIAAKAQRHAPDVSNRLVLACKEDVLASGCKQHEETFVSEVGDVCESRALAPGPCPLRDIDAVARDELRVDSRSPFALRENADDVEEISVRQVADCYLLHESLNRRHGTAKHARLFPNEGDCSFLKTGQSPKPKTVRKSSFSARLSGSAISRAKTRASA